MKATKMQLILVALSLGMATVVSAQTLYEETFMGSSPSSVVGQDIGNLGWAATGTYGWAGYYDSRTAGTLINSATLTSVNAGATFLGSGDTGTELSALYTTDAMGAGSYGLSSFSDINLSANPTLTFSVLEQNEQGWASGLIGISSGYILVQNGGNWYASATALASPTSLDPTGYPNWSGTSFGYFDPASLSLTGAAANWVTVSGIGTATITLGSAATSDLTGDITGVGLLQVAALTGQNGTLNFSDLVISVPEPTTFALLGGAGLLSLLLRRRA